MTLGKLLLKLRIILHCHGNGADGKDGVETCHAPALQGVETVAFGFLVEVLQYVFDNFPNTLRRTHGFFHVNGGHIFVLDVLFFLDRVYIVDAERENVAVIDRVHNRVGVELLSEGLRRGQHRQVVSLGRISRKNRRAGKAEQVIVSERLDDFRVHISKLAAVALVEDDDAMLVEHLMPLVLSYEVVQLLNRGNDDFVFVKSPFFVLVLKLPLQYPC